MKSTRSSALSHFLPRLLLPSILLATEQGELPRRPFLGIALVANSDGVAERYRLGELREGIVVTRVFADSSAAAADLSEGDVLLRLQGTRIESVAMFLDRMRTLTTGERVRLGLVRAGREIERELRLQPFPTESYASATVEYGTVSLADRSLRSILTLPELESPVLPAVFLIQGIDCSSIEQVFSLDAPYQPFIERFHQLGFATYRVDKSGVGDSSGEPCPETDFVTETAGFLAALRALKSHLRIDAERIYLLGFSMGGVWGPLLAAEEPVRGLVVYGTIGRPFAEYLLENRRRQALLGGVSPGALEAELKLDAELFHHWFFAGLSPEEIIRRHPRLEAALRRKSTDPEGSAIRHLYAGRSFDFLRQIQQTNLSAAWSRIDARVLAVWGLGDYVSARSDHELIVGIVNRSHPGAATLEVVAADHWLQQAASMEEAYRNRNTRPRPSIPFQEEALRLMTDWISATDAADR